MVVVKLVVVVVLPAAVVMGRKLHHGCSRHVVLRITTALSSRRLLLTASRWGKWPRRDRRLATVMTHGVMVGAVMWKPTPAVRCTLCFSCHCTVPR